MTPRVLAGTSGFSYAPWRGSFYPEDLPARDMLAFYARVLPTVEINNTFYRMPSPTLLAGWAEQVPARFRFALKAPQRITHRLRLRDAADPVQAFARAAERLGARLGPVLFQLPPNLRADLPRLTDFLAVLPGGLEAAFEFRHASWFTDVTYEALARKGVALCIADAEDLTTPFVATAPFGYLRLRRQDYGDADLDAWAARVTETRWRRACVYFKHEESGRGPALAKAFLARTSGSRARS